MIKEGKSEGYWEWHELIAGPKRLALMEERIPMAVMPAVSKPNLKDGKWRRAYQVRDVWCFVYVEERDIRFKNRVEETWALLCTSPSRDGSNSSVATWLIPVYSVFRSLAGEPTIIRRITKTSYRQTLAVDVFYSGTTSQGPQTCSAPTRLRVIVTKGRPKYH
ncbi:hypothetical protein EV421DRAFT_1821590 [Armillaria borealis]|uniref:Uncharacterized protein n=1 Tax=Armillaria borealis TaxID=47425 RepID=A0AA39MLF1_9AGAR|nr:hypothetical protein EV421DRAFT_1821590 [Armillaria borealis]